MKTSITIGFAFAATFASLAPLHAQATPNRVAERQYVAAMKGDLRSLAMVEEAYFSDHAAYYAGTVTASEPLYGFAPAPNVALTIATTDGGHQWSATATHALTSIKCTYTLPQPVACDPVPDKSMLATPREAGAPPVKANEPSAPTIIAIGNDESVTVRAAQSRSWQFEVHPSQTHCVVSGQVVGLSGGDKKIAILVMTEFAYQDWMNNRPARTYFESEPRTEIPFDVRIEEEGRYRLVVWNQSATAPTKSVQLQHTQIECAE